MWARSQGHHTIDRLEKRGLEKRKRSTRTRERHRQNDKHWDCFIGTVSLALFYWHCFNSLALFDWDCFIGTEPAISSEPVAELVTSVG